MRLTEHFELHEFDAERAPAHVVDALRLLCEEVLEPLRVTVGRPVKVTSGWGGPPVHVVGSQHERGEAADVLVVGMTSAELCRALMRSGARYDQAIWYDAPDRHVHVSFTRRRPIRTQIFHRTPSTPTGYTPGAPHG